MNLAKQIIRKLTIAADQLDERGFNNSADQVDGIILNVITPPDYDCDCGICNYCNGQVEFGQGPYYIQIGDVHMGPYDALELATQDFKMLSTIIEEDSFSDIKRSIIDSSGTEINPVN